MKATMAEAYTAVESALPDKFKGMVKNEDQDRQTFLNRKNTGKK